MTFSLMDTPIHAELLSLLKHHSPRHIYKKTATLARPEQIEVAHKVLVSLLEQKYSLLVQDLEGEYFAANSLHTGILLRNVPSKISFFKISGTTHDFNEALRLLYQAHVVLYNAQPI